jgi:hypothetical protein
MPPWEREERGLKSMLLQKREEHRLKSMLLRKREAHRLKSVLLGLGFGGAVVFAGAAGEEAAFGDFGVEVFGVVDGFAVRAAACLS